ncbi:hypothetical protein GOV03_01070 [Candidatus Woesearchaeota archaeon]|nr:hypothetical protein [Candidatus Woesearchaeota archaeon]
MPFSDLVISRDYVEEFKADCRKNAHRTTLGYFGIDLIIDGEGEIHCIEINGQNSGTSGFKEAYGEDRVRERVIKYFASFDLPLTIHTYFSNHDEDTWAQEQLGVEVKDFGETRFACSKKAMGNVEMSDEEYHTKRDAMFPEELAAFDGYYLDVLTKEINLKKWIGGFVEKMLGRDSHKFEGIIWNNTGEGLIFDEDKYLVVNSTLVEGITESKFISNLLMYEGVLNCYPFERFNAGGICNNSLIEILKEIKTPKVIFKPNRGQCGNGVVILDKKRLLNSAGKLQKNIEKMIEEPENHFDDEEMIQNIVALRQEKGVILQPFIESRPFYNPQTRKHHRGSIRHIVTAHSHDGIVDLNHEGAYVRLAPGSIDDSSIDSSVANLSRGACALPLSAKDFHRISKWVDKYFKKFYYRALCLGKEGHCDPFQENISVQNYLFLNTPEWFNEPWRESLIIK